MLYGYAGRILCVDLSTGGIAVEEPPEKVYRDFVGGYGFGACILYERMAAKVDPLGQGNVLGLVTGPLTSTPVPGSGRYMVVTKSPMTGTWAESNSGGSFGPELKMAGYDAIFFFGVSPEPVYLQVMDGKATLRDARGVWGKDTYETNDIIVREIGDSRVKVACIGPSGEAESLLAGIVNEKGRVAARSGVGAVMGSKRLKAVAIRGATRRIPVGNPAKLRAVREEFLTDIKGNDFKKGLTAAGTGGGLSFLVSIGDSPIKNWQLSGLPYMPTATRLDSANMDKYKVASYGCLGCPVRCGALIQLREGPFAIPGEVHRPEYETLAAFGPLLLNDNLEAIIQANDICNRYGIDTISTGGTIAFAMECYNAGLLSDRDADGLDLAWGNAEAIVTLTHKIARREGFGAALADGAGKASERIGRGSEKYAMVVRGKGLPYHDPRNMPAMGTVYFADANPANHTDTQGVCVAEAGIHLGTDPALHPAELEVFGDYDKKGQNYGIGAEYHQLLDSAGLCSLFFLNSPAPPVAELLSAVTGWDLSWPEALKTGRRILTLRQAFNAREGLTPNEFQLPKRLLEPHTVGPAAGAKIDFQTLRASYYAEMGWDLETGIPSKRVLADLDLSELCKDLDELREHHLLPP